MAVGQREPSPVLPPLEEGRRPAGRDPFIGRRHPDARRRVRPTDPNDPQYYWLDPEDEVSQDDYHQRTILALYYLFLAPLKKVHPDLWVRADLPAAYRFTDGRGRVQTKVMAPDVMVGEGPEPDRGGSYHSWEHGQLLFAVEVASPKTERHDLGTKLKQYGVQLRPKEILCYNPRTNVLRLYRWNGTEYELVFNERWVPGKWVRVQSQALNLGFGIERAGELDVYDAQGRRLTRVEEYPQLIEAAQAAVQEVRAELQEARTEADQVRAEAAAARSEAAAALARAREEEALRRAAEEQSAAAAARLQAVEQELAWLRAERSRTPETPDP